MCAMLEGAARRQYTAIVCAARVGHFQASIRLRVELVAGMRFPVALQYYCHPDAAKEDGGWFTQDPGSILKDVLQIG
jgi:hypothetical protein